MVKLPLPVASLQRGNSCRSVACVVAALVASCATGTSIHEDDIIVIPSTPGAQSDDDLAAPEGAANGVEPSTNGVEAASDAEPLPASGPMSEGGPGEDLPRGDQPGDEEPSSSPPADEEPRDDDPEQVPPEDIPIVDTEPDPDLDPITPTDPLPPLSPDGDPPSGDPSDPPGGAGSDPAPVPPIDPGEVPPPVLPTAGHCLAAWEGSRCDVCSSQTQSDLLACRLYIDCYIDNDCDPVSCGSLEQVCGVNRLGNGLAPKGVADAVYGCMCAP
jgi:hypothetical protein